MSALYWASIQLSARINTHHAWEALAVWRNVGILLLPGTPRWCGPHRHHREGPGGSRGQEGSIFLLGMFEMMALTSSEARGVTVKQKDMTTKVLFSITILKSRVML